MRRVLLVAVLAALLFAPVARPGRGRSTVPSCSRTASTRHTRMPPASTAGSTSPRTPGEAVLAPAAGTVSFAGTVPGSGRALTITTGDGLAVTLTHLGSIVVARARRSRKATAGRHGRSKRRPGGGEPYVHLGVRVAAEEQGYVDPLSYLPARGSAAPASGVAAPAPAAGALRRVRSAAGTERPAATPAAEPRRRCPVADAEPGGGRAAEPRTAFGRGRRRSAAPRRRKRAQRRPVGHGAGSRRARPRAARRASRPPVAEPRGASSARAVTTAATRAQPDGVRRHCAVGRPFAAAGPSRPSPADPVAEGGRRATRAAGTQPRAAAPSHGTVERTSAVSARARAARRPRARSLRLRRRAEARSYHWPSWRRAGRRSSWRRRGPMRRASGTWGTRRRTCPFDVFARYHRLQGQRRAGGERHRRARDAGDGGRRRGREVLP